VKEIPEIRLDNLLYNREDVADVIPNLAMQRVEEQFKLYNHKPSKDHLDGLRQITKAIEGMAYTIHDYPNGEQHYPEFDKSLFVSFLPCGMGKTTTLIETIKAIMSVQEYDPISFIVFLGKLDEIDSLIDQMKFDEKDYSVITRPEAKVYNRGNQKKEEARVLFTTQQMLEARLKDSKNFADIRQFHYKGKPRQVRVWDEAILPSRIQTVDNFTLLGTLRDLQKVNGDLANDVMQFAYGLKDAPEGSTLVMPDFSKYGDTLDEALRATRDPTLHSAVEALFSLAGSVVRVHKDNRKIITTLHYEDILPDDLAPMLILDASGQQRTTYAYWHKYRKGLKKLHSPEKSYKGFTVHHWNVGGGKASQRRNEGKEIATGVARTINRELPADKKCLVIHFKPENGLDMEKEIRGQLEGRHQVKFLTWGRHTAINDFQDYECVILAGLLQYPEAAYHAYGHAAKGQGVEEPLTPEEFAEIRLGEISHNILQAACRGKVRRAVGDGCPEGCHLYLIFHEAQFKVAGHDLVSRIFPDCTYQEWLPVVRLQGKKQRAVAETIERLGDGGSIELEHLKQLHKIDKARDLEAILKEVSRHMDIDKGQIMERVGNRINIRKARYLF